MNLKIVLASVSMYLFCGGAWAQSQIINAYGRNSQSLNGEWHAIIDPYEISLPFKDLSLTGKA